MRKFVIDKVLYLLFGIAIGIGIYVFERYIVLTVIFETILITCLASQCSPLFALLIDVFKGSVTKEVYLSGKIISWGYDFFSRGSYTEWKFYYGSNDILRLRVPDIKNSELLEEMKNQRRDQKLKVTYYNLSKILISFEPVYD
ncbi:MAG: hypothetical protein DBY22_03300 [Clostridiales bacterium]|nr:MAG: hypothetical protein DBY22_03300 [Clostridiales bacterium]